MNIATDLLGYTTLRLLPNIPCSFSLSMVPFLGFQAGQELVGCV